VSDRIVASPVSADDVSRITTPYGALSQQHGGAPSALAPGWSDDVRATIELGAALDAIASRAVGPLGASRIRARRPALDPEWIRRELARVGEIAALFRAGDGIQAEAVPELGRTLSRLRLEGGVLDPHELLAIRRTLAAARRMRAELRRVAEQAPRAAELDVVLPETTIDRRLELAVDDDGELLDTASPALAAARQAVQASRQRLLRRLDAVLRQLDATAAIPDSAPTLRNGRYVIPVRRDSRSRPNGIVHDESSGGSTLFLEPGETVEQGNAFREAQAGEEREVRRVLRELSELLRPVRLEIAAGHAFAVAMDDLIARARWAAQFDAEVPAVALAPARLCIVRGRHPLLLDEGRPVVPFDLVMEGGERTLLISGPNTGGKTVLLKATALACALAQCGIVPAVGPGSALPIFASAHADIGDHQSIAASLSTFSAHVAMVRQILDAADDSTLVLFDEIGSGTDPAEGAALAASVLTALTQRGVLTLATTHLGALKSLAGETPGVVNASLEFDGATLQPTYRFQKGVPGRSYGLAIARRLGVPEALVAEAEARVPEAERELDRLLAAVEARAAEQRERARKLEEREIAAGNSEARLALETADVREREKLLLAREKDATQAAQRQAKQLLLDARKQVEQALAAARGAADEAQARDARRVLEQGLMAVNASLSAAERTRREEEETPAAGAVSIGVRVRTSSGIAGEVLEIRDDGRLMLNVNGKRMVLDGRGAQVVSNRQVRKEQAAKDAVRKLDAAPMREANYEIDLRGLTGDEAEERTIAALDAATLAEQPYLRIIHGMGTGVVRDRVRRTVGADRRVSSYGFAPREQGGMGCTIVELR
jgi:DNA mismatch repair protein MutS2